MPRSRPLFLIRLDHCVGWKFMKIKLILPILILYVPKVLFGQLDNHKDLIKRNKVKSQIERLCNNSCSTKYSGYDKRGNLFEFDFYRTGTRYKYFYDGQDNNTMILWIDKNDPTKIDTLYPKDFQRHKTDKIYREEYYNDGRLFVKSWKDEILKFEYDENCNLIKEKHFKSEKLIFEKSFIYF